ncbi:MAG: J domain-containing protein [Myxococcota bacterium]|nr:J domain-containing protein [Myxococcota bacterium]
MTDYYALLEIKPTATQQEISNAYKALVKKYHPDKHEQNELKDLASEKLTQLNEAYSVLSNARRRAEYDAKYFSAYRTDGPPIRRTNTVNLAFWLGVIVALPLIFRYVKDPRLMGAIAVFFLLARLFSRHRPKS